MTLVHNLQIGAEIGQGYFGKVHAGDDPIKGKVAVKILTKAPTETDAEWKDRRKGLLDEGRRLSNAEHHNVVKVHSLVESDSNDAIHLVMDFCPGGCLGKQYEAGPMTLADVRRFATQVTMGLAALHARNMIHRDIKPSNILLNKDGVAQLGDFGLVTDQIVLGYASQQGYVDHLAPEVHAGGGTSVKTDIWALGMTIYRLVHGGEWYSSLPAPPRHAVGKAGFAKNLPFLPHVPKVWRTVIRTMMHDDPKSRYQTANAVSQAYSRLHTTPRWSCIVNPTKIEWTCVHKTRKYFAIREQTGPGKYSWSAWSEPAAGKGNRRNLGSAVGVDEDAANREMSAMFAKVN